jgi:hypothetical protein
VELQAAGVLAALAATVFAAQPAGHRRATLVALPASLALATLLLHWLTVPEIGALAFCIAAAAVACLVRLGPAWLPPIAAGITGAVWISLLEAQGLPWPPAVLLAAALLAAAAMLPMRRQDFAPADVRDEALVLVACFALLLAVGPDVADGWRSATALTAEPLAAAGPDVGPALAALVVACLLLGGVYSFWKRR